MAADFMKQEIKIIVDASKSNKSNTYHRIERGQRLKPMRWEKQVPICSSSSLQVASNETFEIVRR